MPLMKTLHSRLRTSRARLTRWFSRGNQRNIAKETDAGRLPESEAQAYFCGSAGEGLPAADLVDDRTWADLEMWLVFERLNGSVTALGKQYLYALLRTYQNSPALLAQNADTVRRFATSPDLCTAVRQALLGLREKEHAQLAAFLFRLPVPVPPGHRWFYALAAATILCPLGLIFKAWFLIPCLALWISCLVLNWAFHRRLTQHSDSLGSLAAVLSAVPALAVALRGSGLPEAQELQTAAAKATRLRKRIVATFLGRQSTNDLFLAVIEYLNVLCLLEVCLLFYALLAINGERDFLLRIFALIGRIDAFQGLADRLATFPALCNAELADGGSAIFEQIYHPLVRAPVPNTLSSNGKSLLLTGVNMAGKTTFIKTIAVNLLLGQTLGVCTARRAVLPRARLKTFINRKDALAEGQSYFYFEATEILRLAREAEQNDGHAWFVVDELFRGTNTVERVAAGAAVLSYLAAQGTTMAATHDLELTAVLAAEYDSYHFSEILNGSEIRFDYQLRKGPSTARNAIRLLESAGYPAHVVHRAHEVAQRTARA
jgi:hypothetical protein